jgi:hypothetical protein
MLRRVVESAIPLGQLRCERGPVEAGTALGGAAGAYRSGDEATAAPSFASANSSREPRWLSASSASRR